MQHSHVYMGGGAAHHRRRHRHVLALGRRPRLHQLCAGREALRHLCGAEALLLQHRLQRIQLERERLLVHETAEKQ